MFIFVVKLNKFPEFDQKPQSSFKPSKFLQHEEKKDGKLSIQNRLKKIALSKRNDNNKSKCKIARRAPRKRFSHYINKQKRSRENFLCKLRSAVTFFPYLQNDERENHHNLIYFATESEHRHHSRESINYSPSYDVFAAACMFLRARRWIAMYVSKNVFQSSVPAKRLLK